MTKSDLTSHAFELIGISVRVYRAHLDQMRRAVALKQAHDPTYTDSDYVRELIALQSAIDLGEEPIAAPPIVRGRGGSLIDQAAAQLGMSRHEFEQHAIRQMAAAALSAHEEPPPHHVPPSSGSHKRTDRRSTMPAPKRKAG
jgi:hypothetical protein